MLTEAWDGTGSREGLYVCQVQPLEVWNPPESLAPSELIVFVLHDPIEMNVMDLCSVDVHRRDDLLSCGIRKCMRAHHCIHAYTHSHARMHNKIARTRTHANTH